MSPISFLSRRYRAQRLGRVRLGIKKVSKTGKEYPAATPYFVLGDAPALQEIYGGQPTSLNVEFLWDNLDLTFPNYMRRYTASGLRCLGDGEVVLYRVNDDGDVDVRDGNLLHPNGKVVMGEDNQPVKVACKGEYCPFYEDSSCKPTGYLRFLPVEAPRLGYYDLVCHQRAVVGILTQLKLTLANFHHLTGIPFVLHRGEEEKVPVKVPGKGMVDMPVRTQWIEIDPGWFAENWPQREVHRALAAGRVRQDMIELFGEDSNGDNLLPPPAIQEAAAPVFEGEGDATEPSPEMPPEPESGEKRSVARDAAELFGDSEPGRAVSYSRQLLEAGFERLVRETNDELGQRGFETRTKEQLKRALESLGYTGYRASLHDQMLSRLIARIEQESLDSEVPS